MFVDIMEVLVMAGAMLVKVWMPSTNYHLWTQCYQFHQNMSLWRLVYSWVNPQWQAMYVCCPRTIANSTPWWTAWHGGLGFIWSLSFNLSASSYQGYKTPTGLVLKVIRTKKFFRQDRGISPQKRKKKKKKKHNVLHHFFAQECILPKTLWKLSQNRT